MVSVEGMRVPSKKQQTKTSGWVDQPHHRASCLQARQRSKSPWSAALRRVVPWSADHHSLIIRRYCGQVAIVIQQHQPFSTTDDCSERSVISVMVEKQDLAISHRSDFTIIIVVMNRQGPVNASTRNSRGIGDLATHIHSLGWYAHPGKFRASSINKAWPKSIQIPLCIDQR